MNIERVQTRMVSVPVDKGMLGLGSAVICFCIFVSTTLESLEK